MGGAGDLPQRSSSPLKRRAEEFETADTKTPQPDDVDMLNAPGIAAEAMQDVVHTRKGSVDMLKDEMEPKEPTPRHSSEEVRPSTENLPSIDEQIAQVKAIVTKDAQTPLVEGSKIYLVSKRWLSRVLARGSDVKGSGDSAEEIGPVDNSDIVQEVLKDAEGADFARLRPGLAADSFEYFPLEAWTLVVSWYGTAPGSTAIIRTAHNTNQDVEGIEQCQYELYPPVFKLHRVWSALSPMPLPQKMKALQPEAPMLVSSQSEKLLAFLTRAKKELQIDLSTKVRMWRIPVILPAAGPSTPSSSSDAQVETAGVWAKLLVDSPTFCSLETGVQREELAEAEDVSVNSKYNGNRTLATTGLLSDETLVFEEQIKETPTANGIWLTTYSAQDATNTQIRAKLPLSPKKPLASVPSVPITRGRANRNGKTLGVIGLSNMGNTCYMNSALQCVRSVEELTKYFLTDEAAHELNPDNPLGNRGEVAQAYGRLLNEIYRKDSNQGSIRPANFKNTIGKYAPSFSGYGQQDSQEFLGFLLDGLQEDLSRVKKKPYIEKPDSTDAMVNNPELIRDMAAKVWDITKKRDDSVIADLFTGMYKSTLVCPVCAKVSITFDPFNNLTLQLPIADSFSHTVTFFPLNDVPVEILVDIDKNATIKAMKEFIGKRVDVAPEKLMMIDHWHQKIYKIYDDYENAGEISSNDKTHVYELDAVPTNWPAPPKATKNKKKAQFSYGSEEHDPLPGWDDPVADRILVPVLHRVPNNNKTGRYHNSKAYNACLTPFFITLTQNEAYDMNIIKRKILEKAATLTDHRSLHDDEEDEIANSDIVITTGSDADSSGDGKVTASSVDGEDDVVDVTMKDPPNVDERVTKYPLKKFKKCRPKFLNPSTYLEPELQNMFDMCYFSESDIVPTGWHTVGEDKILPNLTERDPRLQAEIRQEEQRGRSRSDDSSTQGSDDDEPDIGSVTRMADESSDEDTEPIALPVRPVARRSNPIKVGLLGLRKHGLKTYSKKGNKFTDRLSRQVSEDVEELVGPLVRLGEGICIDWKETAFDTLFQGDATDTLRGSYTLEKTEHLRDPALDAKIKARAFRKRNGVTLDECLDEFQREEILSEMDTWYCPRCKEHQRASKKFELWKTPDILIIHLKRFSSLSNRREKLDFLVDFPLENLDISSRVIETEPGKQEVYDLFAVDDHWGGLGGGHYTAFAKSFMDNHWYEYNDSMTSKVSDLSRVVSPAAYLLFYRRRSDVPLGGPKIREVVARYDNPPEEVEESSANESGEDQRLAANSSQHGSSSALTGVDQIHRRGGSIGIQTTAADLAMIHDPPAYREAMESDEIGASLLLPDTEHNNGLDTYEDDEGLGMDDGPQTMDSFAGSWNFSQVDQLNQLSQFERRSSISNTSAISGSDVVAHGSDIGEEGMQERLNEFNTAATDDDYIAESPPPDIEMNDDGDKEFALSVIQDKLHVVGEVEGNNDDDGSNENVDEIHV